MTSVVVDLQGAQSVSHRDRGVARYVRELAIAIEAIDASAVRAYVLNPTLPAPGGIEPLVASGKLRFTDEAPYEDADIVHLASPFELSIPLDQLFPRRARRGPKLVCTVFDMIPEALADSYLADAGLRRRYRVRRELVRQADHLIAISRHSAGDAARVLGVAGDGTRTTVTELAPSSVFVPGDVDGSRLPAGVDGRFVLYTGGTDERKNLERLLEAWGRAGERVTARWKLVVACKVEPLERNHYEVRATQLGFGDGLVVTGFVPEDTLVALNQAADLVVWPSLYEGFGLPVAEALACGTPAIGANTSSTPELLPPEALFDPTEVESIADAIARALTDRTHRERLVRWARERPPRTWADVARETLAVYERIAHDRATRHQGRVPPMERARPPRMAFVTPLPPIPGGVSDYSFQLLGELAKSGDVEVHAFVDGPPHEREAVEAARVPEGVHLHRLGALEQIEALEGRFDALVWSLGNSEFHTGALAALLRLRRGTVIAHDVRLTNLYRFAPWQHRDAAPGGFGAALHAMYDGLSEGLGTSGEIAPADADRWSVLMARDAIAASDQYLVTSRFALELARLDARPADRGKLAVLPFSVGAVPLRDPTPADQRTGPPVVATFGVVNDRKQAAVVVEAFELVRGTHRDAQLVFVGPVGPSEADALRGEGVELTGTLPEESYLAWLDRAWVAVQLRAATHGESSGAVGDCLTAGVPTVITAIGPARDLPDDAVAKVEPGAAAADIAAVVADILDSPARRRAMSDAARRYAADHSFARAAAALISFCVRMAHDDAPFAHKTDQAG
ncbi:MAG TPA: glycosyltransferase [Acidimicrobiales bacterium]